MVNVILLLVLAALIGAGVCSARHAQLQRRQAEDAELQDQLSASRRATEDDVVQFGEELQRLEAAAGGVSLEESVRQDYTGALAAHGSAKASLDAADRPESIRHVTEILEGGRYTASCAKARLAGQPAPQKRPPCFFNPAHGPSVANVSWAPAGGTQRDVPACPADSERVLAGADPYIRTVAQGAHRVPYWEGGQAYAPWAQGYFRSWRGSDLVSGALVGSFVFGGADDVFNLNTEGFAGVGEGVGDQTD